MIPTPALSFALDRTYAVPPEAVWTAFTRADLLQRWACPDPQWRVSDCEVDPREGGGDTLVFGPVPDGIAYRETAAYVVFEPVERIVMDTLVEGEGMSERCRVTVALLPVEGGTRLDLEVDGIGDADAADRLRTGWIACLELLAAQQDLGGPAYAEVTVTPVLVGDLFVGGDERMPVYVHVVDHPDGRVLVDTGMAGRHPLVEDMDPRVVALDAHDGIDLASIDLVVCTHLHFDHCGGNALLAGRPVHVQRQELDDALALDDYTIREWVQAPGVEYVAVDGELELLAGLRLVPAPGHTRGSQVVVIETGRRTVVIAGDTAVWHGELDDPTTPGQQLIRSLHPDEVWLSHAHDPWRPPTDEAVR